MNPFTTIYMQYRTIYDIVNIVADDVLVRQSSVRRDAIIFYACTMEVWHFSSYLTIKNYINDDIRPHPTQFS